MIRLPKKVLDEIDKANREVIKRAGAEARLKDRPAHISERVWNVYLVQQIIKEREWRDFKRELARNKKHK